MNELVTFKGNNTGLNLIINQDASFEQIQDALEKKLASCPNFFEPNTILTLKDSNFTSEQKDILTSILKQYTLCLKFSTDDSTNSITNSTTKNIDTKSIEDLIINRTIRGGEEIIYKGSIIIHGNVNPGAKVIAGGNIDILGTCRGFVHAGAYGNLDSYIIADHLLPLQIRIAHLVARAPDNGDDGSIIPLTEKARICDEHIILEPFQR